MYPHNVQAFSNGYEQVSLRTIVAQIRRPLINNRLLEDIHYWQTGESKAYDGEPVFLTKPGVSGYIRAIGSDSVEMNELFVTPQLADSFELTDLEATDYLLATPDHATQLERFFA